jgi:hypothetical protein
VNAPAKRGVQGRLWVTLTEIAEELRVRPSRVRELGILDQARRLPAGVVGRWEVWRWEDVDRAVLQLAVGEAPGAEIARPVGPARPRAGCSTAPVAHFESFGKSAQ